MKKILTAAVVAFATAASSYAQLTPGSSDLFLGFQQPNTDGVSGGSAKDYVIDIGPASIYTSATSPFVLNTGLSALGGTNIGSIGSDLSASGLFGSTWYTNPNTVAAVVGAGTANDFFYTLPTSAATPLLTTNSKGSTIDSNIASLATQFATYTNSTNGPTAVTESSTDPNSWSSFNPPSANASFTFIASDIEGAPSGGFDLYYSAAHNANPKPAAQLLGEFTVDGSGDVTFTPVPEPSSIAILGGGIAMLGLVRRRRA
jgi:hypothetical protein